MFAGPQKQVLRAGDRVRGEAHLREDRCKVFLCSNLFGLILES